MNDFSGEYQGDYKNVGAEYDFECLKPITQVFKKGESSMSNINNCGNCTIYHKVIQKLQHELIE